MAFISHADRAVVYKYTLEAKLKLEQYFLKAQRVEQSRASTIKKAQQAAVRMLRCRKMGVARVGLTYPE